jgi:hypothetical protein
MRTDQGFDFEQVAVLEPPLGGFGVHRLRSRIDPDSPVEAELRLPSRSALSLERTGDLANLARAYTEIGMCRFMLGHAGDGDADLRRAADLARQAGSEALEREAVMARLRPIAWGPTPADDGIAFCTTLLESETTNAAERAHAYQVRGLCAALQGDRVEARSSSANAWALIEEFGLTLQRSIYAMDVGFAETVSGDLDRAERELRLGHDLLVEIGDSGARCTVDAMLTSCS